MNPLLMALYLQIPIVIGGVLHMWVVTRNDWPVLARPIWNAAFGANKTWRGMLLVPALTAFGALWLWPLEALAQWQVFGNPGLLIAAGGVAGLGYVLGELPNSWIKRRIGIAPGQTASTPVQKYLFILMDQLDSALGVAIAYLLLPGVSVTTAICYVATFPITALLVKRVLCHYQLKKQKY